MLTRTERKQAQAAVSEKLDELRATVEFWLGPDADRRDVALYQVEQMRRWLTRQIDEAGGWG
jgi:hypothetical protein